MHRPMVDLLHDLISLLLTLGDGEVEDDGGILEVDWERVDVVEILGYRSLLLVPPGGEMNKWTNEQVKYIFDK